MVQHRQPPVQLKQRRRGQAGPEEITEGRGSSSAHNGARDRLTSRPRRAEADSALLLLKLTLSNGTTVESNPSSCWLLSRPLGGGGGDEDDEEEDDVSASVSAAAAERVENRVACRAAEDAPVTRRVGDVPSSSTGSKVDKLPPSPVPLALPEAAASMEEVCCGEEAAAIGEEEGPGPASPEDRSLCCCCEWAAAPPLPPDAPG